MNVDWKYDELTYVGQGVKYALDVIFVTVTVIQLYSLFSNVTLRALLDYNANKQRYYALITKNSSAQHDMAQLATKILGFLRFCQPEMIEIETE